MFRFRGRIKKRTIVVLIVCLILVLLPVAGILLIARGQIDRAEVHELVLEDNDSRQVVLGNGLNVNDLKSSNLVLNGGFEPIVYRRQLLAASGDTDSLLIVSGDQDLESDQEIPLDGFFDGASIQVLSRRGSTQSLKKESVVKSCRPDQLTAFHPYSLPPDTPDDIRFNVFAEGEGKFILGAERGYLLVVMSSGDLSLSRTPGQGDIIDVAADGSGFLILDRSGILWRWEEAVEIKRVSVTGGEHPKTLSQAVHKDQEGKILLAGDEGLVLIGKSRDLKEVRLKKEYNFVDSAANENGFFLLADNGKLFFSPEGNHWGEVITKRNPNWIKVLARDKTVILLGSNSEISISTDSGQEFREVAPEILKTNGFLKDPVSAVLALSDRRVWLGNREGKIIESQDAGLSWNLREVDGLAGLSQMWVTRSGIIIADSDRQSLLYAFEGVEITLEDPLKEGDFKAGDIVQLEKNSILPRMLFDDEGTVPGDWFVSSERLALPNADEKYPGGGQSVLSISDALDSTAEAGELIGLYSAGKINADKSLPDGAFRLCQQLAPESVAAMKDISAFRIDFWAKAEKDNEAVVEVSLSGLNLPVDPVKRHLDTTWHKYSVILIVPWKAVEGQDVRLNFDFRVSGAVYIDQVEMVSAENEIPYRGDLTRIGDSKPSTLRMAWLPIGSRYLPSEYWLSETLSTQMKDSGEIETVTSGSLSDALVLLEKTQASPWFCIRSRVTESELRHFMQYLFGSNSSEYGAMRFEQGSASRWSDLFSQIYFEIGEEGRDLAIDQNRQAFVDWVIDVITSTPEYKQVKNQLVFVDGMIYRGGKLLSVADSHASDFGQVQPVSNLHELTLLDERRRESFPRDPGRAMGGRQEWIRSFVLPEEKVTAAEYMVQILNSLGEGIQTCLLDIAAGQEQLNAEMLQFLMNSGSALAGMSPLSIRQNEVKDPSEKTLLSYAFEHRNQTMVFVANLDKEAHLFSVSGRDWTGAIARTYDEDGSLLEENVLDSESGIISILPGACVVIQRDYSQK